MNRHQGTWLGVIAVTIAWSAIGLATTARGASVASTAVIASVAVGQGNDFWEDRFNAMQRIWGTPYVPLGYYWDQVRGLPPRPAPVAPGLYADRPIYPSGGFGSGYGYGGYPGFTSSRGYAYAPGFGYGSGFGYDSAYPYPYQTSSPYGYGYGYGYGTPSVYGDGLPYGSGVGIGFQLGIGSRVFPRYGSPYGGFYGW